MAFIDKAKLFLKAGNGGNGAISFLHLKYQEKGGPDGGDGGNGGSIFLELDKNLNSLEKCKKYPKIVAKNGGHGLGRKKNGKNGANITVYVPENTFIYENDNLKTVINNENKRFLLLSGGKGGHGNYYFRSSTNQTPNICENGDLGKSGHYSFILKLLAEIGIVGMPNAGKSTLINSITNAKSTTGDYVFTTIYPVIGVLNNKYNYRVIDIPGLIEGAHKNKGLGMQFLQHIEACKNMIYLLDAKNNPFEQFQLLRNELKEYNKNLLKIPFFICINKCDLLSNNESNLIKKQFLNNRIHFISAKFNNNVNNVISIICNEITKLSKNNNIEVADNDYFDVDLTSSLDKEIIDKLDIEKISSNSYKVSSKALENLVIKIPLNSYQNIVRFNSQLSKLKVFSQLKKHGAKQGDKIIIYNHELEL